MFDYFLSCFTETPLSPGSSLTTSELCLPAIWELRSLASAKVLIHTFSDVYFFFFFFGQQFWRPQRDQSRLFSSAWTLKAPEPRCQQRLLGPVRLLRVQMNLGESLLLLGFPCGSAGKESTCNAGDLGLIPGLDRSPREGKGYPFQYSGLENSMDCIVHGVSKSCTWLSDFQPLIRLMILSFIQWY